jgi:predicted nucleic acid-binding protein
LRAIFADTSYLVASLCPEDSLHLVALGVSNRCRPFHLYTSDAILVELLNDFSGRARELRQSAGKLVEDLYRNSMSPDPFCTIVPQTRDQFLAAFALYKSRGDKGWSLTDCSSCLIMRAAGIHEALTHDRHFEQMGFRALLRADA